MDIKFCIIRGYRSGVHAGYVVRREPSSAGTFEVELTKSRRLWEWWSIDSTLSGIAKHGPIKPEECKFGDELEEIILADGCECITCTDAATKKILGVPEWRQ